jgi:DNA-binding NarL/FixJ family response regulator
VPIGDGYNCCKPSTELEPIKTQRIILAGPKTIFRAGAARVLSLENDMEVVAQCHEPARVRAAVESLRPSTVLLSFALLSKHSELLIPMKRARSGVVLTAQVSDHVPLDIQNQLDARIPLNIAPEDLVTCVRHVAQGDRLVRGKHLPVTFEADPDGARVRDCLTPKEIQVVALITRACKNKEIAERLGTCEGSIKNHLSNIFEKTGLCDRLELAVFALHHPSLAEAASIAAGLLRVPEPSAPSPPASPRRG